MRASTFRSDFATCLTEQHISLRSFFRQARAKSDLTVERRSAGGRGRDQGAAAGSGDERSRAGRPCGCSCCSTVEPTTVRAGRLLISYREPSRQPTSASVGIGGGLFDSLRRRAGADRRPIEQFVYPGGRGACAHAGAPRFAPLQVDARRTLEGARREVRLGQGARKPAGRRNGSSAGRARPQLRFTRDLGSQRAQGEGAQQHEGDYRSLAASMCAAGPPTWLGRFFDVPRPRGGEDRLHSIRSTTRPSSSIAGRLGNL